jgi:hypothetical protein
MDALIKRLFTNDPDDEWLHSDVLKRYGVKCAAAQSRARASPCESARSCGWGARRAGD